MKPYIEKEAGKSRGERESCKGRRGELKVPGCGHPPSSPRRMRSESERGVGPIRGWSLIVVLWRSEASRLSLIRLYLGDFHSLKAVRVMKAAEVKKSATWRDSATLVRQKGLCPPFLRPLILTECSLTVHGAYIYRDASLTPTVASPIYAI